MEFYLKTKYTPAELAKALELADSGMSIGNAAKACDISYSPAWQFITWSHKVAAGTTEPGLTGATLHNRVAELRAQDWSWGDIATTVCINENACRKAFEQATNIQAVGTRTGKGGRFWGDDEGEVLYQDERNQVGVKVEPGTPLPTAVNTVLDLNTRSLPELRARYRALGIEAPMPKGKADIIEALKANA